MDIGPAPAKRYQYRTLMMHGHIAQGAYSLEQTTEM